jgi:PPM family protein phosphatase
VAHDDKGSALTSDLSQAIDTAARTDPGMQRTQNEDAVFVKAALGLAILADGMGGYNAGEVASGMAVTLLATELEKSIVEHPPQAQEGAAAQELVRTYLQEHIAEANAAVYRAAESQPQYQGMGTTLVMGVFYDNRLTVAHIGDSRCYRFRAGRLEAITRDHSFLQDQIDSGMLTPEEARHSLNRNLVTRALGVDATVDPEIHDHDVLPGDLYLFCSDGLNDMLLDTEIARAVADPGGDLERMAGRLVQLANDAGGRDNVSVILVRITADYHAPRNWLERFAAWLK